MNNLYKINDILNENFIRLPLGIIANPKYRGLSSDAKILYSLLCNRLRLSQLNNWVNDSGEVYLIYTREQAAEVLGVSYKTVIKTFKELIGIGLLYEERRGNNLANHLYVSKLENCEKAATEKFNKEFDPNAEEPATCKNYISENQKTKDKGTAAPTDMSKLLIRACENYSSEGVKSTRPDMSNLQPRKKELKKKDISDIEKSPSVNQRADAENFLTDGQTLQNIFDNCEIEIFEDDAQNIYIGAIERLYYSESYKLGNSVLPQDTVRSYLNRLNSEMLFSVHNTIRNNTLTIKNPIGYIMSTIINAVCENNIEMYAYEKRLENCYVFD